MALVEDPFGGRPELRELVSTLTTLSWEDLKQVLLSLGVPKHKIDDIETMHPTSVSSRRMSALDCWLQMDVSASWWKLFMALVNCGQIAEAVKIKEQHLPKSTVADTVLDARRELVPLPVPPAKRRIVGASPVGSAPVPSGAASHDSQLSASRKWMPAAKKLVLPVPSATYAQTSISRESFQPFHLPDSEKRLVLRASATDPLPVSSARLRTSHEPSQHLMKKKPRLLSRSMGFTASASDAAPVSSAAASRPSTSLVSSTKKKRLVPIAEKTPLLLPAAKKHAASATDPVLVSSAAAATSSASLVFPVNPCSQHITCTAGPTLTDRPSLAQLRKLKVPNGQDIRIINQVAGKWDDIAIAMDFDPVGHTQTEINRDCSTVQEKCTEMFKRWLGGQGSKQPPTWETLLEILRDCGFGQLATDIESSLNFSQS
jgi:hypothetical protein